MQSLLSVTRVLFPPELHHACLLAETCLRARGRKRTERAEEVVQL